MIAKRKQKLKELLSVGGRCLCFLKLTSHLESLYDFTGVFGSTRINGQQGHFSSTRQKPVYFFFFFSVKTSKSWGYTVFYWGDKICCAGNIY